VLNVLVLGLTSFLYSTVMVPNAETFNSPEKFERIAIPLLSEIPVLGPILFRQTIIVYLMYIAIFLVWFGLFKTRWGLRLRSVGEHPTAADTVGINVRATRFWNVLLAGAIVGGGGAFFTLAAVGSFGKDMTNGAGFIALAAVIFGRWDPIRATLAALLFGFATNLQSTLSIVGSPVPSEFMLMLPYVVTIVAVAGFVASRGRPRPPASRTSRPERGESQHMTASPAGAADAIDWDALRAVALEAMAKAYVPYSRFPVGVAAIVDDGRVISGCNVENASYGLTLCAEITDCP